MSLNKKSADDFNAKGRRVLVRCDFNVPLLHFPRSKSLSVMAQRLFFAHILARLRKDPMRRRALLP